MKTRPLALLPLLLLAGCPEPTETPDAFVANNDAFAANSDAFSAEDAFAPRPDAYSADDAFSAVDAPTDAHVLVDAASGPPFCPVMAAPADGCVLRCQVEASSAGLPSGLFRNAAIHPSSPQILVSVGTRSYGWIDLSTGAFSALADAADDSFGGRPVAISPDGMSYLRSRDSRVERVGLADGVATEVLRGGGTTVEMDFLPSGSRLIASGRAFALPFPAGGYAYADGTSVGLSAVINQSISPSGTYGSFRDSPFSTPSPSFHVINVSDRSTDVVAPTMPGDSDAALLSDSRLLVVGQDSLGRAYIDAVDLPTSRTRLIGGIPGLFSEVVARGELVVVVQSSRLSVYACDPS